MSLLNNLAIFASPGRVAEPTIRKLADCRWKNVVSYREHGTSREIAKKLKNEYGGMVKIVLSDISSQEGSEYLISQAVLERIDRVALINIASRYPHKEAFSRWERNILQEEDWEYFNSNFGVMQNMTRALLKWYNIESKRNPDLELDIISFGDGRSRRFFQDRLVQPFRKHGKRIIDFTIEDAKRIGMEFLRGSGAEGRDFNPYMLSKLLIQYVTRELALEYHGGKVRINALAPGIMESSPNDTREDAEKFARESTILQRIGGVTSAADKIAHLLNDNAYMTGEIIPIDGGQHLLWLRNIENSE